MPSKLQDVDAENRIRVAAGETESGLDENIAGALSYLFGIITGLVFYLYG